MRRSVANVMTRSFGISVWVPLMLGCVLVMFVAGIPSAKAQVLYGTLVGTVQDATGAVVPGSEVSITNQGTGETRQSATDAAGAYNFANVSPGIYDVHVTASGFRAFTSTGVAVRVNAVSRMDVSMEVGQITESVTVAAAAATLQTDKADVHVELTSKEVADLPLPIYRNYQSLLNLVPGAAPGKIQASALGFPSRSIGSNINGTALNNNNSRLDGAINNRATLPHTVVYVPPAESIETVNISTNNFDAEQGFAGGAAVTVTTKSGTNEFHGVAYNNLGNSVLNAKDFFYQDEKKAKNVLNMYGGTLGGPIKRDKLFFFLSYEALRQRENFSGLWTIPTTAQREGDFSGLGVTIYDPDTGNPNGSGRTPFANAQIPHGRQSEITRHMQSLLPDTNQPGTVSNFFNSATFPVDRNSYDGKINWNRTQSHMIWGKYTYTDSEASSPSRLGAAGGYGMNAFGGATAGLANWLSHLVSAGTTYTLSPRLVLDGVFGYTLTDYAQIHDMQEVAFGTDVLGIPGTNGPDPRTWGQPYFEVSGYEPMGGRKPSVPKYVYDVSYTAAVNVGYVKGAHDIRFGVDLARHKLDHWHPEFGGFGARGGFRFNTGVTALQGSTSPNRFNHYAAFLLGLPSQSGKSLQFYDPMTTREWMHGYYLRDRWQVNRNLTLSLGLRWEYYPIMNRADGSIERYDLATNMVHLAGFGGVPKNAGIEAGKRHFAPRFGIAYRLGSKSVIRTGYGISVDPYPMNVRLLGQPYPVTVSAVFNAPNSFQPSDRIENGIPEIVGPDRSPGIIPIPSHVETTTPLPGTFNRGYVQSWNLVLERQLPFGLIGSAGYVATQTTRQPLRDNVNAGRIGGGNNGRPLVAQFGRTANTFVYSNATSANYHSLQVNVSRPFTNGLLLRVAYTWSKAINFSDDAGNTLFFSDPTARHRNRARATYDVPQNFRVAAVYELPFGAGKRWANQSALARAVLGGWQMNGVFGAYSGTPFTVTASGSSLNAPGNNQTADQVLPEVRKLGGVGPNVAYYDPLAFRAVSEVRFGTAGRNILRGPGVVNFDYGIFRTFSLSEHVRLQFKAEAFNLTNTPHFSNPGANASNMSLNPDGTIRSLGNFMSITSTKANSTDVSGGSRTIRFALRLSF